MTPSSKIKTEKTQHEQQPLSKEQRQNKAAIEASATTKAALPSKQPKRPSSLKLVYDGLMLVAIIIDLILIGIDLILMSNFAMHVAQVLGFSVLLADYVQNIHPPLKVAGGFFTLFLIVELLLRWILSIIDKQYIRWFFFPFIHWYEVLGCLPQLRALRLLRAFVIGRKLYFLGYQVVPQTWISKGQFYISLILEELSDRVILTATDNIRTQLSSPESGSQMIKTTLAKNRPEIEALLTTILHQELSPRLKQVTHSTVIKELSTQVGGAVQDALANTPELRRYLRMIPIAGRLIESELYTISQHIGENLVTSLSERLTQTQKADALINGLVEAFADIEIDNPALNQLIVNIINDSLTAFEDQVNIQQWKHDDYLHFD